MLIIWRFLFGVELPMTVVYNTEFRRRKKFDA